MPIRTGEGVLLHPGPQRVESVLPDTDADIVGTTIGGWIQEDTNVEH